MINNEKSGLSPTEALILSRLSEQGKNIFTMKDAKQTIEINKRHLENLLQRLVNKKWLQRIEKGLYMIIPLEAGEHGDYTEHEFIIASRLINPYAISYWSALNYHGFTEQIPGTVFVSSTTRKKAFQIEILRIRYKFIKLSNKKFFGLMKIWIENKPITITDREKTIIDCLDHPEYCGGIVETIKGIWNGRRELDFDKITEYGIKMGNGAIFKRLGYLTEVLDLPVEKYQQHWQGQISAGYNLLDPHLPKMGKYVAKWRLRLNIPKDDLLEWRIH